MISEVHRFLFPNHSNNPHTGSIKTTNHSSSWQSDSINPQKLDIIGKPETMAYPVSSNRKGATYSTPFETDRTIISRSPSFTSNGYNSDDRSTHSNASDIMSTDDDVTTPINNGSPVSDNYTLPQLNISNQRTTMLDEPYYDHDDMNIKSKERVRNTLALQSGLGNVNRRHNTSSPEITPLNSPISDTRTIKRSFTTTYNNRVKEDRLRKTSNFTPPPNFQSTSNNSSSQYFPTTSQFNQKKHDRSFSYDDRPLRNRRSLETLYSVFESQLSSISPSDAPLISRPTTPPILSNGHHISQVFQNGRSIPSTTKSHFTDDLIQSRSNSIRLKNFQNNFNDRTYHNNDNIKRSSQNLRRIHPNFSIKHTEKFFDSLRKKSKDHHPIYQKAIHSLDAMQFNEAVNLFTQLLTLYPHSYSLICYRAYSSLQAECWNKAIGDLNKAISKKPRRSRAYSLRGEVYRRLNRFDDSLADLNMSLKLKKNIFALRTRAEVYSSMELYYDAIKDLDSVLDIDPKNVLAIVRRAKAYHSLGEYDDALMDLELALNLDPINTSSILMNRGEIYRLMGRYDLALNDFNSSLQSEETLFALERRGTMYRFLKRDKEALNDFSRVLQLDSRSFAAHKGCAEIYLNQNDYDKALIHMNLALQLEQFDFSLLKGRGKVNQNLGYFENALKDYNIALRICQDDLEVLLNRGELYRLKLLDHNKAMQDYTKVLEIDSKHVRALSGRGETYRMLKQFPKALHDLNEAIRIDPDNADALQSRGAVNRSLRRYEEALRDLDDAIILKPNSEFTLSHRGFIYRMLKRDTEALADLKKALKINPKYVFALENLGALYISLEKYDEALENLNMAVKFEPSNFWALTYRAEALKAMGKGEEALRDLNKVLERSPDWGYPLALRGGIYLALKSYKKALTDLNKALEHLKNNKAFDVEHVTKALCNRGAVHLAMERYHDALSDFNMVLIRDPRNQYALNERKAVYRALGRSDIIESVI